ncbi:condensin complex subunit 1-like [Pollicipes pollicipes]|nr:condensin complex subunit 1-like [Pollicipes pollicipes]
MMVLYFKDSVAFARLIDEAIPGICGFLRSAQTTDVLEAVSFFVTAFEFGLLQAMVGIRQMLSLIWSREAAVKEAVVTAYRRLYVPAEGNERFRASQAAASLSALCEDASLSELASLEELVVQLVGSGHLGAAFTQLLWERFTGGGGGGGSRRPALLLIGMVAG